MTKMNSKDSTFSLLPHISSPAQGGHTAIVVTTRTGETLSILSTPDGFKAILQNRHDVGLATKLLPVYFGPGYSFSSISQSHSIGYVKDVQLLPAKHHKSSAKQIVYIGKGGLLGGGGNQTKSHSCEGIYKCTNCPFQCPNGKCIECCIHKTHPHKETQKNKQNRKDVSKVKEVLIEEEIHGQMSCDENYDFTYNDVVSSLNTEEHSKKYNVQVPSNISSDEEWKENHNSDITHSQTASLNSWPLIVTTTKHWHKSTALCSCKVHSEHSNKNKNYNSVNLPFWLCVIVIGIIWYHWWLVVGSCHWCHLVFSFAIVLLKQSFKVSKIARQAAYNCKLYMNHRNLLDQEKETHLLQEHVMYERTDCISIEKFKSIWKDICETYENKDRVKLLKLLIHERMLQNMSLVDICNVLKSILQTDKLEISNICKSQGLCLHDLKRKWIKTNIEKLCNTEEDALSKSRIKIITDLLTENDWSTDVCEIFLKCISDKSTEDLSELFTLLQTVFVPEAILLSVLVSPTPFPSAAKVVGYWTMSLSYHMLCKDLREMNFDITPLAPVMYNLLQASCSQDLLLHVITKKEKIIKENFSEFIEALKLLNNYQVKGGICTSSLLLLQETHPQDWLKTIDKHIVTNIFRGSKTYNIHELIEHICQDSYLDIDELKTHYNSVSDAYCSCTKMAKTTGNLIFDSMREKHISKWSKNEIGLWAELVKKGKTVSLYEKIAVIKRAVKLAHDIEPRAVQILTLLVLLHPHEGKGRLVQVNTGEGKSLIVAMLAAVHAIEGTTVDVITTSTELSIPEVRKQRRLFSMLHLTVSENSGDIEKKQNLSVYGKDIVYGTASDFQADILRKEFQGLDCRNERGYGVVIVDEVDSMLYDSLSCSVRLSAPIPGMNHLEIALGAIWERVNRIQRHLVQHNDQIYFIPDEFERTDGNIILASGDRWQDVAESVVDKEAFIIERTMEHMKQALRHLSDSEKDEYETHKMLLNQISEKEKEIAGASDEERKNYLKDQYENLQEEYKHSSWHNYYPVIEIPVHLHEFAVEQLPYWIKNAVYAAFAYRKDFHYTVQKNRIVPIHYNETGVLQPNLVWSDGLTQFLQMKEDLPVEPESITTNFISNISFFQRYGCAIYGLTGTLGQKSTQEFLSTMYEVDVIVIPPHKIMHIVDNEGSHYLCKELVPIIVDTEEEWCDNIVKHALFHAKQLRAVLVICKFIDQVRRFAERIRSDYDSTKIFTYTGEKAKFNKKKVCSGEIIIATIIGGRGTDIKTSPGVELHGGMYVMVTFLPDSYRVELQNVGRTGREGKKGMAQIIVQNTVREMTILKRLRTDCEEQIDKKAIHEAKKVLIHDELFKKFCDMQCKYLPSVPKCEKIKLWRKLTSDWDNKKEKYLYSDQAKSKFKTKIKKELKVLGDVIEDSKEYRKSQWKIYVKKKEKMLLKTFCDTRPYLVPADLLACLRDGRNFEPNISELAKEHKWGQYERDGLTERWGLWYKRHHFENQNVSSASATSLFNKFEEAIAKDAKQNKLIKNPFYYVLKGNDHLKNALGKRSNVLNLYRNGELKSAISCYELAISLDPAFSLHAHYNKACALLSFSSNKGQKQRDAFQELQVASNIINLSFHPYLVTFHTLLAQTGVHRLAALHIKHQYDVLSQQLNCIEKICEFINPGISSSDVSVHLISVKKALEILGEDYSKVVIESATNGLTHLFTVKAFPLLLWKDVFFFALIGIAEIAVGCLLSYFQLEILGMPIFANGICNIMSSVQIALGYSCNWNRWGIQNAISIATLIMTAGWKVIKKSMKRFRLFVDTKVDIGKIIENFLQTRSVQTCVSDGEKKRAIMNYIKGKYKEMVSVTKKIVTHRLLQCVLVKVALGVDNRNCSKEWEQLFVSEATNIINEEDQHDLEHYLQDTLCLLSDRPINNEETEDETHKFMEELEKYINIFSDKFVQNISGHKETIQRAANGDGFIFVRTGKWIWKNLKDACEINLDIEDVEKHEKTMCDERSVFISNEDEDVKIHPVLVNENDYYTTKANPVIHHIGDSSYSHETSIEDLATLFTERICQAIFLNMKYKSSDSEDRNLASEIFHAINESNARLRETFKLEQQTNRNFASGHSYVSADNAEEISNDDGEIEYSDVLNEFIKSLQHDFSPNIATLELLAKVFQAPILICKHETMQVLLIEGDTKSATPIMLKIRQPKSGSPSGGWSPLMQCSSQEVNDQTFIGALWTQMSMEEKTKVHNQLGLIKVITNWIHCNTEAATELLLKQNLLNQLF